MLKFQSELTAGGGLRKRTRISQVVEEVTASPIAARIQKFDIYNKAPDFVRKKTWLGGFFSAIVAIALAALVISELTLYLTVNRQDTLSVDSETGGKILIYLNITYPRVHCDELHIDTVDQSGAQQIDVHQRIFKTPTDEQGQILDFSHMHRNVYQTKNEKYDPITDPESPYYCGSCYGAESADKQCCNSCEEVKQQWKRTGRTLPHDLTHFDQCLAQGAPGCNMYGALEVQKVGGNFHFAPGRSFSHEHDVNVHHIHEFNPLLVYKYNGSHIINELTFGEKIPHVKYPLTGVVSEPTQGLALHKYFIKVVPTTYKRGFFTTINSYQYSVTKHVQTFDPTRMIVLPGVFFVYELSPMRITYRDYNEPFLHFIVRLCAVFGGLFAVAGYIDKFLHMVSGRFAKKAN